MKTCNLLKLPLVAAAVTVGIGSAAFAQDDNSQTEEVQRAAKDLERAQDRRDTAEHAVDERKEDLQQAIDEAAKSDADASDRSSRRGEAWDDSDWDELVDNHSDLRTFVDALRFTGLDKTLSNGTTYTVFAPTDEAFDDAFHEDRADLLSEKNRQDLIDLLRAHIVADDVPPDRARELDQALTVDGDKVDLSVKGDELEVGDAEVVGSDIHRGNLRIYPIDGVLDAGRTTVALKDSD
jgi:uncharacterized surface protein with fasciclin (FAS1) repeats